MAMLIAILAAAAAAQGQADLNNQAGRAAAAADAALNVQYRKTMAAMKKMDALNAPDAQVGPSYQNALLAAQRAWLAYRDAECQLASYEFRGGSAMPMAHAQCLADLTNARTKQLKIEMWER
jgi:uncharacterized protein YecT (DUF1311 family)